MSKTTEERVKAGAELLDKIHPGWAQQIDTDGLDMRSCVDCVLGQLFGNYLDAPSEFGVDDGDRGEDYECGFIGRMLGPADLIDAEFLALNAEWRRVIAARKGVSR